MTKIVLKADQLYKTIGSKEIIHAMSFELEEGKIYGFLGPNGSGKTTTIRMLTGLIKISKGDAYINGYSITKERERALEQVGAIVENPELYEYMTGRENLIHFANMAKNKVARSYIEELIQLVDLTAAIDNKVKTYSLGMKQRLGIAQALLHQPKILILDEPTNGLDPAGIRKIRDYLRQLAHEQKITIIVSSHLLSEIEMMCDEVIVIHKGKFIQSKSLQKNDNKSEQKVIVRCKVHSTEQLAAVTNITIEDNHHFTVELDYDKIPMFVVQLVEQNIAVFSVVPIQETLEEQFLKWTGGGVK
ncbi:ABC transporter ATP-binding protein [Paenibacillus yanchengensis]|uniref:ABC transporter ATP-binding protein n=1 Tax=Paenibacillus yanchengensis TaxID=2035833 RepID=A0ABW4YN89_9BACL